MPDFLLCSDCFKDFGLAQESLRMGLTQDLSCRNCKSLTGRKLSKEHLLQLANVFFVWGSAVRTDFGGAARLQFREEWFHGTTERFEKPLDADAKLIQRTLKIGFLQWGPDLWRLGDFDALNKLTQSRTRRSMAEKLVAACARRELLPTDTFFRLRANPSDPSSHSQFDSPPAAAKSKLRFNQDLAPIMYGSQDLEICLHECRVAIVDELYLGVLRPTKPLILLDLTQSVDESIDRTLEHINLAIHMLFRAEDHSYRSSTAIAQAARLAGLDGIVYPSYFSQIKGGMIPNLALFGRPIASGIVVVECINRVVLKKVDYTVNFGPVL